MTPRKINTQQVLEKLPEMEPGFPRGICLTPLLKGIKKGESAGQVIRQATSRWRKDYHKYLEDKSEGVT